MADNNNFIIDFSKAREVIKNNKAPLTILNLDKQDNLVEACKYEAEKLEHIYNFANEIVLPTLEDMGFHGITLSFLPDDVSVPLPDTNIVRYVFTDSGYKYIVAIVFREKDDDDDEDESADSEEIEVDETYEAEGEAEVDFECYAYINRAHMLDDGTFARDGIVEEYDFSTKKWQDSHFTPGMLALPKNEEDGDADDSPVYTEEQEDMIRKAYSNGQTALARFMAMMFDASFQETPAGIKDIDALAKQYSKLIDICGYAGEAVEWAIIDGDIALCASDDDRDGLMLSMDGNFIVMSQVEMTYDDEPYTHEVYRTTNTKTMLDVALPMILTYSSMQVSFNVPLSKNAWIRVEPSVIDDAHGFSVAQYKTGPDKKLTPFEVKNMDSYMKVLTERYERRMGTFSELTKDEKET